jgi:hypothetical protein
MQGIHVDLWRTWGGVPAVPEQPDGGLVPPVKVLRKRVNGVYRADGFSGPTRRYVLVVALLVALASLPTLAAITAGSNELERGTTGAMDVPFLPPPSSGPVVPVQPAPSSGVAHGQAGKRRTMPHRYVPRVESPTSARRRSGSSAAAPSPRPVRAGSAKPERPGHAVPPNKPAEPTRPADPEEQVPPVVRPPFWYERGKFGVGESRHHRPDWSRHRHCEETTHRAHWSHDGAINQDRSQDRPDHIRRSTVTERPFNIRPPRWGDRTHNSRRHHSESRWADGQAPAWQYRGVHRADEVAGHYRSSRVGRHHAGRHHDHSGWE